MSQIRHGQHRAKIPGLAKKQRSPVRREGWVGSQRDVGRTSVLISDGLPLTMRQRALRSTAQPGGGVLEHSESF